MEPSQAHEVHESGADEMTLREIVVLAIAVYSGFVAGMLCMRENYLGIIRSLWETIKEYEQRK